MKRKLSISAVLAVIVAVMAVIGLFMYRTAAPAPGPDPKEAIKHMGLQAIADAKASGPPPGRPPPTYPSREEFMRKKSQ